MFTLLLNKLCMMKVHCKNYTYWDTDFTLYLKKIKSAFNYD